MSLTLPEKTRPRIVLPDVPALAVTASQAAWLSADGEVQVLNHARAQMLAHKTPVMVCHAPYTAKRLGAEDLLGFDVLELFAFVHPAKFCVPTPVGLARMLGLAMPQTLEDMPGTVMEAAQALLADLQKEPRGDKRCDPLEIAKVMGLQGKGWVWTPYVCAALGEEYVREIPPAAKTALGVWRHLPEWTDSAPPPPPAHHAVTGEESRQRLKRMLGEDAETRSEQMMYATEITTAFLPVGGLPSSPSPLRGEGRGEGLSPIDALTGTPPHPALSPEGRGFFEEGEPHVVLAEAGTGVGKTLGYLAPASVWAEKNDGPVWVSTYTRNLQRQIDQELSRLHPDPELKARKVAVRKGRENYLCLLNFEDQVAGAALAVHTGQAIAAGLMARWAGATRDGDLTGGDFPGWLAGLLGWQDTMGLADRRGECIYSACDHYHKCFVERAVRKARFADIVVANHALVMIQTALSNPDAELPRRYVFDEGHHLFDAADSAFGGELTARETADLRRWLRGPEGSRKSRARGLKRRVEDLIAGDMDGEAELQAILHEAGNLPAPGWSKRLKEQDMKGPAENFIAHVYRQVYVRAEGRDGPYSLEADTRPVIPGMAESAAELKVRLRALQKPMRALAARLKKKLEDQADTLDSDTRRRLESVSSSLTKRGEMHIGAWIDMLETLAAPETPAQYIDWMQIERMDGQAVDVGLYRHWVDPMQPFAAAIKPHAHGIAITSATLRDATGNDDADWAVARERTGADFLTQSPKMFSVRSPYDYAGQTKVFIVSDVRKDDLDQVAAAYRVLFEAAGGGALGLFTSISRLRSVHDRIARPLEMAGIPLYAQHIDEMDTGTLVDIFREEIHTCLLGTDAVRDGVDVPGESLRMLVYDRVPWPRPTILHRARRNAFGGKAYDERLTRLKLRQAYGRLVRRATDKGVFVMMDSMLPSRLLSAFPEGVSVEKKGLTEIAGSIRDFLERG
jgi:ATP-dependent DNA helicase DinG